MPLQVTKQALVALKNELERTDETGYQALRLVSDDQQKLHFVLDTPRETDRFVKFGDVTVMIVDSDLGGMLGDLTLDVRHTAEGTYWTLVEGGGSDPAA